MLIKLLSLLNDMLHLDLQHWVSTCTVCLVHSEGDSIGFQTSATLLVAL